MKKLVIAILISNSLAIASPILNIYVGSPPDGLCQTTKKITLEEDVTRISNSLWQKGEDKYIADSTSKISIWESRNNLLQGCRNSSDWIRYSDIVPGDGTEVVSFSGRNCSFDGSVKNKNDVVVILFQEQLGKIEKIGDATVTRYFYKVEDWYRNPAVRSERTYDNYYVTDYSHHGADRKCLILSK